MQFTCSQAELSAALALVGRAVSSKPTHPILSNVLLAADAATSQLSLTCYDLVLGIRISIPAAVETSGAITLPAKLFSEIVSRLPAVSPITVSVSEDAQQADITSLSGSYQVRLMSAVDYPDLPLQQSGDPVEMNAADVIRGLRATLFASCTDESKQLLTGVHFTLGASSEFAATDGHRLAVLEIKGDKKAKKKTDGAAITVPAKSLRELERMLSSTGASTVNMFSAHGQIVFTCDDQVLCSRSLDGTYPAYRQLIPSDFAGTITVDRKSLQGSLERVAVLADQHNSIVKISVDPDRGQLQISADAQDVGSGMESLAAEIKGDAMQVAFNVRYLLDGLRVIAADEVTLHCNAPTAPALLTGDEGFTYLIMPVQVRA